MQQWTNNFKWCWKIWLAKKHAYWDQNDQLESFRSTLLEETVDQPDVETIYLRCKEKDSSISIASIYRSLGIFIDYQLIQKLDVGDGKVRFEIDRVEHDYSMDVETGQIHEFKSQKPQKLTEEIVSEMEFELTKHRLEIYGRKHGRTACRCHEIKVY